MKASKQNLECAETILRQHGIDNRALRRDIALTIDMAEEAARYKVIEQVRTDFVGHRHGFVRDVAEEIVSALETTSVHEEKSV